MHRIVGWIPKFTLNQSVMTGCVHKFHTNNAILGIYSAIEMFFKPEEEGPNDL